MHNVSKKDTRKSGVTRSSLLDFFKELRMKKADVIKKTVQVVEPILKEKDLVLWDVEFQKEGATDVLRVLIDKEGGVNITDCEYVSKKADPILDELDFIDGSYSFEVSSAGLDRALKKKEHFLSSLGKMVDVRFFSQGTYGQKEVTGILKSIADDQFSLDVLDETWDIMLKDAASVKWHVDF